MKIKIVLLTLSCCLLLNNVLFSQISDSDIKEKVSLSYSFNIDSFTKPDYQWISYQGSFTFDNEENGPVNAQFYFVNRIDSIIYLNIHISGIELGRAVFTPDSMIFVNKTNKSYYSGNYDFISHYLSIPVNFSILQAIFNASNFIDHEQNSQYIILEDSTGLTITGDNVIMGKDSLAIYQKILLNNSHKILNHYIEIPEIMEVINIAYMDYSNIDNFVVFLNIKLETSSSHFSAALKNIKINIPGTTAIHIPKSFMPINTKN